MSSKATKKLYSYGNKQPLQVAGTFTADVLVGNRVLNEVEFVVIESEGHALLFGAGDSYCSRGVAAGTSNQFTAVIH